MTKTKLAAYVTALMLAVTLSAQKYSITVETHIAGRPEDKLPLFFPRGNPNTRASTAKFSRKGIWQKAILRPLWIWRNTPILPKKPLKKLPK